VLGLHIEHQLHDRNKDIPYIPRLHYIHWIETRRLITVTNSLRDNYENNIHLKTIFNITFNYSRSINYWRLWSSWNGRQTPIYANSCLCAVQYSLLLYRIVLYCTIQYITVHYSTILSATPTYAGLCTTNKIFHTSCGLFGHSICNNFWYKPWNVSYNSVISINSTVCQTPLILSKTNVIPSPSVTQSLTNSHIRHFPQCQVKF